MERLTRMTKSGTKTSVLALLGLAQRAGALARGTASTRRALKDGRARLVVLAGDAAEGQRAKVLNMLRHRETPQAVFGTRAELGAAIGSSPVSAIAVTEVAFAGQLQKRLAAAVDDNGGNETGR